MTATAAAIGHGSSFAISDMGGVPVYTDVAEVFAITPPNLSRDTVDATHMASTERWREFVGGLRDGGEVQIQLNFVPGGSAQDALVARLTSNSANDYRITFPNSESWIFSALCTRIAPEDPLDGKMTLTAAFKLTGKPAFIS